MDKELAKIPGITYSFTQPMGMRLDETVSGVKADLAIKIFGDFTEDLKKFDVPTLILPSLRKKPARDDPTAQNKLRGQIGDPGGKVLSFGWTTAATYD
jgi:hypothetical protein